MNIRAFAAEVLTIAMSIILFINIFINVSSDFWLSIATFLTFIVLAFYLIKSIMREARQKELLKELNDNLELRVADQTLEIRKSYELEKKARRDLEKLNETKNQFIMMTQHHLRAPVTNIRYGLEIMEKETGRGADKRSDGGSNHMTEALVDTKAAANRLTRIVDDFLSITALKAGGNILDLKKTYLLPFLEDVLQELHLDIEHSRLTVRYPKDAPSWPDLDLDGSKIREALLIVIDNAVKYNIPSGTIDIRTNAGEDGFEMVVENTGTGIAPKDRTNIFKHLFYRTDQAKAANPTGMGIGLSVARAIVRAHHGELTIGSEGAEKGARVTIKIPYTLSNNPSTVSRNDSVI